jgi:hypothetical protein
MLHISLSLSWLKKKREDSSGFARYIVIFSVSAGTAAVFSSFLLSSFGSSFI